MHVTALFFFFFGSLLFSLLRRSSCGAWCGVVSVVYGQTTASPHLGGGTCGQRAIFVTLLTRRNAAKALVCASLTNSWRALRGS